ncbi:MAG: SPOR domain-containing protein, partial [Spirochaetia bacterium]|nr:SPOR domain-containing protein [Spirochaetia bacterium]
AAYIHAKGHVVLLPKDKSNKNLYSIYVGPYKSEAEAQESMKKLGADQKFIAENSVNIIKRSETK